MVQTLENIDKSKVYVDRIEGLDEVVSDVIGNTLTGAVSTITTSDLTAGKILVSDNNGKVAASNKTISDIGGDSDNLSITKNTSNKLQTVGVINQNATTTAIKTWTGTKAEYDAIVTKDNNTLYNITDDTDLSLSILATLYPVGAIYIGTMDTCPLSVLGLGTWVKVSEGRVLQGSDSGHNAGTTIEAGLPNITGGTDVTLVSFYGASGGTTGIGAFSKSGQTNTEVQPANGNSGSFFYMNFDASDSNSIYGNSTTVQPSAFIVNIWKRTA